MSDVLSEIPNPQAAAVDVQYNGYKLTPAPFVDWTVEPQFDDLGVRTADRNRITLTGTVLVSPSGSYEQMYVKQEELRTLFATDYRCWSRKQDPGSGHGDLLWLEAKDYQPQYPCRHAVHSHRLLG